MALALAKRVGFVLTTDDDKARAFYRSASTSRYSYRSAIAGSTVVARRAGM